MKNWPTPHAVWVILLLGLILRLPLLNGSFWMDEAAQALESARPFSQQLMIAKDFQPPLMHLIVHFSLYISSEEWWLRTVAALLPGLITIWGTYQIGKVLVSRTTGIIASLLLATSSFHIFFSQELRPYSLPTMFAIVSWLLILKIEKNQSKNTHTLGYFLLYTGCTILGLYASYLYPFLLVSQIAYIFFYRRLQVHQFLSTWLVSALSFSPWLPAFYGQLRMGGEFQKQLPGWVSVVSFDHIKSIVMVAGKFIFGVADLEVNLWYGSLTLLLLGLVVGSFYSSIKSTSIRQIARHLKKNRQLVLLLTWLIVPFLTAWLVSFWVPVVQPKRVLYLLPVFYVLVGWLGESKHLLARALVTVLLLINLGSTWQYFSQPRLQREDWRSLHTIIAERYPISETLIVFSFDEPFAPWRWYDQGTYETLTTGQLYIKNVPNLTEKLEVINNYRYIVVFDYLRDLTDPDDELIKEIKTFGYEEADLIDQPNIGFVRIYARKHYAYRY
ncbi:MAG TPA: glycosyltransferase family 39 protein [Patescibacteria group bacterium]